MVRVTGPLGVAELPPPDPPLPLLPQAVAASTIMATAANRRPVLVNTLLRMNTPLDAWDGSKRYSIRAVKHAR
jgi:hypothetical protein